MHWFLKRKQIHSTNTQFHVNFRTAWVGQYYYYPRCRSDTCIDFPSSVLSGSNHWNFIKLWLAPILSFPWLTFVHSSYRSLHLHRPVKDFEISTGLHFHPIILLHEGERKKGFLGWPQIPITLVFVRLWNLNHLRYSHLRYSLSLYEFFRVFGC